MHSSFEEYCKNGSFLDSEFNGTINGFLIGPEFYSNQLNLFQRIFFGVLFSLLSGASIVGNGLALLTVSKRKLQVLYRCCVISQCVGDLLTAVFVGLNALSNFIQDTIAWNFGEFMCGWIPYVTTTSALLSSMILTCIAIDRYQGVVLLSGKWDPKVITATGIVSCLWLVSAGTTVPTFLGYNQIPACFIDFEDNTSYFGHLCLANQTISNYYFFTIFSLIFLPLLVAFIVLYSAIARMMWMKKAKDKTSPASTSTLDTNGSSHEATKQPSQGARSKKKVRTFTIILVIMATFILCRLPQWIFIVVTTLPWVRLTGNFWWNVKYLLSALSLANTTINPFIYSFLNEVMNLRSNLVSGFKNIKKIRLKNFRINLPALSKSSASPANDSNGSRNLQPCPA